MRTVALLVQPNGQILAVDGLVKPREPMASGYINEHNRNQSWYYEKLREYEKAVKKAVLCNQKIALQVLAEQHPNADLHPKFAEHYDVKNILFRELVDERRRFFTVGEEVECIDIKPLPGNDVAPPLKEGKKYPVKKIYVDYEGNQHLDVGLKSKFNYIKGYEIDAELPDGDKVHWCHPTRFK